MTYETFINIISLGITSCVFVFLGGFLFKNVRGGIKIPILYGGRFVNKMIAFVVFIISIYLLGWGSLQIQEKIRNFMLINQENLLIGIIIPLLIFYFIFDQIFYKNR